MAASLDSRILSIVQSYEATKAPAVCYVCDGVGSHAQTRRYFGSEFFIASRTRRVCEGCGGRGTIWFVL